MNGSSSTAMVAAIHRMLTDEESRSVYVVVGRSLASDDLPFKSVAVWKEDFANILCEYGPMLGI